MTPGFNISEVLKAAKKLGFENILGGTNEREIWISHYWTPPNSRYNVSDRLFDMQLLISQSDDSNFKIELKGPHYVSPPKLWNANKAQLLDGQPDLFLIKIFENYSSSYIETIGNLLVRQKC